MGSMVRSARQRAFATNGSAPSQRPGGGKLPKVAAFDFEHQYSAGRAENQKVPFSIRVVIKAPADHPSVRQKCQAFGDDQFRRVTTFDRSLVDPSRHIYLPNYNRRLRRFLRQEKISPAFGGSRWSVDYNLEYTVFYCTFRKKRKKSPPGMQKRSGAV